MNPCNPAMVSVPTFLAQVRQPVTLFGRRPEQPSEGPSILLPSLLCGLCVVALGAIAVRAWRRRTGTRGRRALMLVARSLGLSASERALIGIIGAPEPAATLVSEHAFRCAVERWATSNPPESARRTLVSLAARLGWTVPELPLIGRAGVEARPLARPTALSKPVRVGGARLVA